MTNKALIIVDVQNDFISGSLPVPGGEQVAQKVAELVEAEGTMDYPHPVYDEIVTTQDWHYLPGDHWSDTPDYVDSWPVHGKAGTEGAALHDALRDLQFDAKFFKGQYAASYSGFDGKTDKGIELAAWLISHDVTEVDVVGLATDYCVKATALDAIRAGFTVNLLSDLTAAVTPEGGQAAIEELKNAGVNVK